MNNSQSLKHSGPKIAAMALALILLLPTPACNAAPGANPAAGMKFGPKEILTTAVEITIHPARETNEEKYPAGTPVRILKQGEKSAWILIGPSKEQAIVPLSAIVETGGTGGTPVKTDSVQPPAAISIVNGDGKNFSGSEYIWTGIATGDENVPSSDPGFEERILELTNAERTKRGLKALVWDEDLARAARYMAADQYVQNYGGGGHDSFDVIARGGKTNYMFREEGKARIARFAPHGNGENLGEALTPENTVADWMASPNQKENILHPTATRIGVGVAYGTKYGTKAAGKNNPGATGPSEAMPRAAQVFGIEP